jgi:hypothetical protein
MDARPCHVTLAKNIVDMCIAEIDTCRGTLQILQTRVESGRDKCPRLNGVLVRPDHLVSFHLEDLVIKSQLWLLQTNWPAQEDFLKVRP